jgi:hypothetical protein
MALVCGLPAAGICWTSPTAVDLNTTTAIRFDSTVSAAAGNGNSRGVVWASDGETTDNLNGVFFSRSADAGATWSPRVDVLNTSVLPLGSWGERPCIATDSGNTWVIAWDAGKVIGKTIQADRDIYFLRSSDGGLNWSTSGTLNANAANTNIRNYDVNLATDKLGTWCSAWSADVYAAPTSAPSQLISVSRSSDNALTWPAVQFLDDSTSSSYNQNPAIATNGAGTWMVAWDVSNTTDTDIRYCRSTDNGITWSAGNWLNTTAVGDDVAVGNYDGQVRLAGKSGGVWVAVWTSSYDPASTAPATDRVLFARSVDNGATWSAPAAVAASGVSPRQTPDIVWSGSQFALMWSGPSGLEASYSSDGSSWSAPVSVAAATALAGGSESRPRLAAGTTGLRLGAWVRRPATATGPDIAAAQDASGSAVTDWNLMW